MSRTSTSVPLQLCHRGCGVATNDGRTAPRVAVLGVAPGAAPTPQEHFSSTPVACAADLPLCGADGRETLGLHLTFWVQTLDGVLAAAGAMPIVNPLYDIVHCRPLSPLEFPPYFGC